MPKRVNIAKHKATGTINGGPYVNVEITVSANLYTPERNQLAREVSRLASAANKRLKRLENNIDIAMTSPAYRNWLNDGANKFSVKGKNTQELKLEYQRLTQFMQATTSTLGGARNYMNKMIDFIGLKNVEGYTGEQIGQAIQAYWKLQDMVSERLKLNGDIPYKYQRAFEAVGNAIQDNMGDLPALDDLEDIVNDVILEYNALTYSDMQTLGVLDVLL